jgi:putative endonuclease
MSKHSKIGVKGEQIAADFLLNKGYIIIHRNWRSGKKEIDIIASKDGVLVIAEIKTRTNFDFGFPEEAVNRKKQQFLKSAAEVFIDGNPQYGYVRFDIISILMDGDVVKEIMHFEEAFY